MFTVDIWCIGDLNYLVAVLNSLAMVAQSGLFEDLVKLGLILAVLVMALQAVFMMDRGGGLPFGRFIVAWVLFKLMFGTTATVWVHDTYTLQSQQVDNVPYGVAFAGSVTSKVAHEITQVLEQAFSTPAMLDNGFASSLEVLNKVRKLPPFLGKLYNGKIQKTLEEYAQNCTAIGINMGQINGEGLKHQANPWQAMRFESQIYTAMTWLPGDPEGGTVRTCTEAWSAIDNYLSGNFWTDWQGFLQTVICQQQANCNPLATAQSALEALGAQQEDARNYMLAAVLLPVLEQGQINLSSSLGKPEMSIIVGQAREQRNAQWKAESSLFMTIVRPMMAFFEGFLYAITPFMALLVAFVPSGLSLIFKYLAMFIWVQLWMPILAVLNHYLHIIAQQKLSSLVTNGLISITSISGQLEWVSNLNDWLATAGMLAASTPAISLALLFGGAVTMTHLAGRLRGGDHINEKIAAPDVVQPGAIMAMAPRYTSGDIRGHHATGAESVAPKFDFAQSTSSMVHSAESQVSTAQQSFREAESRVSALNSLGSYAMSHQAQSTSGLEARSGEGYSSTAAYSTLKAHQFSLDQSEFKKLTGLFSGGAKVPLGSWADLRAQLEASFGTEKGNKIAESIKSDLNLKGDKSVQAAIDEKMSSMVSSGELRQYVETHSQQDTANLEKARQQVDQAQKQYSETQQLARRAGMSQGVSAIVAGNTGAAGMMGMSNKQFIDQHGRYLDMGAWDRARLKYRAPVERGGYGLPEENARWAATAEVLNQQGMYRGNDPELKVKGEESRKLFMQMMDKMGFLAADTGDASKFKGVVDSGQLTTEVGKSAQAAAGVQGPGDVSSKIQGIKGQMPRVQSRDAVEKFYDDEARGIRSQQEGQRIKGADGQFVKASEARWHLASTRGNLQKYEPIISRAARQYGVAPELIRAVIRAESNGDPNAVSPKGAGGLMQLMPGTARDLGVTNVRDPEQNIMGGTKYLRQMLNRFGDSRRALAAYNWGPENVARGGRLPQETEGYVGKVMGNYQAEKSAQSFFILSPANAAESPAAIPGKGRTGGPSIGPSAATAAELRPDGKGPEGVVSASGQGSVPAPGVERPGISPGALIGPASAHAAEPGPGDKRPDAGPPAVAGPVSGHGPGRPSFPGTDQTPGSRGTIARPNAANAPEPPGVKPVQRDEAQAKAVTGPARPNLTGGKTDPKPGPGGKESGGDQPPNSRVAEPGHDPGNALPAGIKQPEISPKPESGKNPAKASAPGKIEKGPGSGQTEVSVPDGGEKQDVKKKPRIM